MEREYDGKLEIDYKIFPGKPLFWVSILIFDKSFYIRKALIN